MEQVGASLEITFWKSRNDNEKIDAKSPKIIDVFKFLNAEIHEIKINGFASHTNPLPPPIAPIQPKINNKKEFDQAS